MADPGFHTRRTVLLGAMATALAAPAIARSQTLTLLSVKLDWTPWANAAAIHLAAVKGWYREAGLDVTVADGNGSTQTVQIVGGGSDIDVGHAALSSMIIARTKGFNLKAISNIARRSDIGLMVPVDSSIGTIADLRGKRLAHTASSLETPFLGQFLAAGGLTKADVTLVNLDGGAKLAAYLSGKVDGAFSSIPFFVPAAKAERPSKGLLFADANLEIPSFGTFARDDIITVKRDALTRFTSVVDAAWTYILNGHHEEGVDAIFRQRPNAKLNRSVMLDQLAQYVTFFKTPAAQSSPPGWMAAEDWREAFATLEKGEVIKPGSSPGDFYTNAAFDESIYQRFAAR